MEQTLCWFCGKGVSTSQSALNEKIHRIVERKTNYLLGRVNTQFEAAEIQIPRCTDCEQKHERQSIKFEITLSFLGLGITLLTWHFASETRSLTSAIVLSLIGLLLGIGLGAFISEHLAPRGTKPLITKEDFPELKALIAQGWALGKKPPYKGDNVPPK